MSIWSWLFPQKVEPACPEPEPLEPVIRVEPSPAPVPSPADFYFDYRPIFNLLGKSEGTDKGRGYNETLSYGAYTGGDVSLIEMTLGKVDKLQTKMLSHPKNSLNSSALGRYQIVRTTLRKLKKTMEVTDETLFNEKCQDHMALMLLEGRGLSKYLDGRMKEDTFLTNLAKEWASIPTPSGKGYYGNQSKTPVTPQEVRDVLAEVKRRIKG